MGGGGKGAWLIRGEVITRKVSREGETGYFLMGLTLKDGGFEGIN